jgi:glycosyltransferase involved in cell wall biosynthesis
MEWKKGKWGGLVRFFLHVSDYASCRFANETIVVSETLGEYYRRKYKKDVICISNGVNTPRFKKAQLIHTMGLNRHGYILYMGRLSREKGVHRLIEAYRELDTEKSLVLAGDFADDKTYESIIKKQISLDRNIYATGFVKGELWEELLSNSFLYVLPSEVEGSPISLLEAMSYGSCSLVSDIPENLEALSGYGYSFKARDTRDLKRMLELLLSRTDLVSLYKEKAREHVLKNYSWDKVTDDLEKLYYSLLGIC